MGAEDAVGHTAQGQTVTGCIGLEQLTGIRPDVNANAMAAITVKELAAQLGCLAAATKAFAFVRPSGHESERTSQASRRSEAFGSKVKTTLTTCTSGIL